MAAGFFAFFLSIFLLLRCLASQHPHSDAFFVSDFFQKLKVAPPSSTTSNSSQVCSWRGVSCEGQPERVVGLVASGLGLAGPIPETTIGELAELRVLDLSDNNITGLPSDFGKLGVTVRTLNLSSNKIRAAIPGDIGEFKMMETLDLSSNEFSGEIPAELGSLSSLRVLNLSRNSLEMSIPDAILGCVSLISIDLSHNRLNGTVPTGFGAAFKDLTTLDLSGNEISGKMPDFSELNSVIYLNLSGNIFQQLALGVFRQPLQVVDLSNNQFHGLVSQVNLSAISNLSSLVHLDLSMNELSGEFFPGLGDLQSLKHLNLAFNKFSGQDFHLIELPSSLEYLNLSRTNLTGRIPPGISRLANLKVLDLSQNHIAAGIPHLSTAELQVIDLSVNNLTGEIPKPLQQKLSAMEKFNFSYNNLTFCGEKFSPETLNSSFIGSQSDCPIAVNPYRSVGFVGKKHVDLKLGVVIAFSMFFALAGLVGLALALRKRTGSWTVKQTSYREEPNASGPFHFQTDSRTWTADVRLATSVPVVIFEKPLMSFTFADLLAATCHFDRGTLLAEGRHGPVYRGFLPGGIHVAVKVLVHGSSVTDHEAEKVLERLGRIKHPNLVPLTGYCLAGDRRIAIYDYMENGNLQNLLHDLPLGVQSTEDWSSDTWEQDAVGGHGITSEGMTTWRFRHKIALGTARALAFLHHGCLPQMVHGNVKASSIYLDSAMEPRLAGFGLAGVVGSSVRGEMSPGHAPPEFSGSENAPPAATTKADVFGFGVVLFELISGKKPAEDEHAEGRGASLVSWARALVRRNEFARLVDAKIQETGSQKQLEEALRIAYLCTADLPLKRPSMQQIVGLLKDIEPVAADL